MHPVRVVPLHGLAMALVALGCGTSSPVSASSDAGAAPTDTGQPVTDGGTVTDTAVPTDAGASTDTPATDAGGTPLNDGYRRATWGAGVTITYGNCTLRYQSNGLPNHTRSTEYALPNAGVRVPSASTAHAGADPTVAQTYDVTFNTCPTMAATPTATNLGNIGYMISGASLFNPYEGDGSTIALASNFSVMDVTGSPVYFVDSCNGHPTPMGQYHYHGFPACVSAEVDTAGGPSHLLGIALDGYPVYGNTDMAGHAVTASQLDACNGITSATPEFPAGVYHYVLLNTTDGTSSLRCYRGVVTVPASMGGPGGMMAARDTRTPRNTWGCGSTVALAQRDPAPLRRVWSGIRQSLRDPLGVF